MPKLLAALLCALPALGQAQIYKWVDAKGVTHYSDNQYDAGNAPVIELKRNSAPPAVLPAGVTWQERDAEFRRLQQHKLMAPAYRPGERQASRCNASKDMPTVCR
jgi:hypothetical protein